ncbi:MAG TPA: Holliday junction resolvase RuvX [Syntrophales bacterium]|nr:Holliday junction resolvase RuvX [Syntrophales bacterium]
MEPTGAKRAVGAIEVGRVYATEDHMRIMGMDYGEKRIGIALSDELGLTAQGLPTIVRKNRRQVLEAIGDLIARYGVERIVLGYPIRLDGSEAVQCAKVNRFAATLRASFDLPVIRQDETLTTREAEDLMREAGLRRERRRRSVDRVAASLILQGYLNACRSRTESGTIHE